MATAKVVIEFLTALGLDSPSEAEHIFSLWGQYLPELMPERFGHHEPLKKEFTVEAALADWKDPFYTLRRVPRAEGSVHTGGTWRQHSTFKLELDPRYLKNSENVEKVLRFLTALSRHLEADFSFAHLPTEADAELGLMSKSMTYSGRSSYLSMYVTTFELVRFIPDVYWATVFGGPYVRHFGMQRLLSSPAYHIEALGENAVLLQLSAHPLDLQSRYAEVDAVRRAVKEHLDQDSFFDPSLHPPKSDFAAKSFGESVAKEKAWYEAHRYNVPRFEFQ